MSLNLGDMSYKDPTPVDPMGDLSVLIGTPEPAAAKIRRATAYGGGGGYGLVTVYLGTDTTPATAGCVCAYPHRYGQQLAVLSQDGSLFCIGPIDQNTPVQPSARVVGSGSTSIPIGGAATALSMAGTELWDTDNFHTTSANQIVIPYNGVYAIDLRAKWATSFMTGQAWIDLRRNGTVFHIEERYKIGYTLEHSISTTERLTSSDTITAYGSHIDGGYASPLGPLTMTVRWVAP